MSSPGVRAKAILSPSAEKDETDRPRLSSVNGIRLRPLGSIKKMSSSGPALPALLENTILPLAPGNAVPALVAAIRPASAEIDDDELQPMAGMSDLETSSLIDFFFGFSLTAKLSASVAPRSSVAVVATLPFGFLPALRAFFSNFLPFFGTESVSCVGSCAGTWIVAGSSVTSFDFELAAPSLGLGLGI